MSHSVRRTPIMGLCADSDKPFKRIEHGRERVAVREAIHRGDGHVPPKCFGNPWDSCKDGKYWIKPDNRARWMRK